ncbi:uncharacterized protein LOC144359191 [Saccoglossus kowalevskii]
MDVWSDYILHCTNEYELVVRASHRLVNILRKLYKTDLNSLSDIAQQLETTNKLPTFIVTELKAVAETTRIVESKDCDNLLEYQKKMEFINSYMKSRTGLAVIQEKKLHRVRSLSDEENDIIQGALQKRMENIEPNMQPVKVYQGVTGHNLFEFMLGALVMLGIILVFYEPKSLLTGLFFYVLLKLVLKFGLGKKKILDK